MEQANPFAQLSGLMGGDAAGRSAAEIAVGTFIRVSPLEVQVGDLIYEAVDITLCAHVTLPPAPGGRLVLISFDDGQTYIAIGRC